MSNKQTVLIIEGPDGCGKTEIGNALSRTLGIPYFRMDSQFDNFRKGKFKTALEFDMPYIASFLFQTGHSVIIDRAYPSEYVYSRVFGRESNDKVLFEVDLKFRSMDAIIIMLVRNKTSYASNRHDDIIPNNRLEEIHDMYGEFSKHTLCKQIIMNVDRFKSDLVLQIPALCGAIAKHDVSPEKDILLL